MFNVNVTFQATPSVAKRRVLVRKFKREYIKTRGRFWKLELETNLYVARISIYDYYYRIVDNGKVVQIFKITDRLIKVNEN